MYLRQSKKYRNQRRASIISFRTILFWIVAIAIIVVGIGIYQNRNQLIPMVDRAINSVVDNTSNTIATSRAPAPTATQDPSNDLMRANDSWMRGAIQEATSLYERVAPATPNDILVYYRLTLGYVNQGKFDDALISAEKGITANPFHPDMWAMRAMALNRLGRSSQAIASASRALELVPTTLVDTDPSWGTTRARALAFLAEAYLNLGQGDRADTTIQSALDLNPDSYEALQVSGRINQEVYYNFDAALEDFRAANELAPTMIYVAIWLARLERDRFQDYDTALTLYQDILDRNPGNTQVLFDVADYYWRVQGNPEEAMSYLSRCIESDPNVAACHYLMGRVQYRREQMTDALISFQTAYEFSTDNGYYNYWLGATYLASGQCQQALPYLESSSTIARTNNDTVLLDSAGFTLNEAQVACGIRVEPTPTLTPEGETENTDA
jgi:tetratricopeptide (TPR) repeat protein